ncbi:hypothetical protein GGS26DRAFT_602936 [Hypomontagnella submonticulosa]|nr:hypothetical protein GGS26DRAFT_602936 [Hypomontagnella submonticulosa]
MCIVVLIHHTHRHHDTRYPSVINPITGHTVYSPWQDPGESPPCDSCCPSKPISYHYFAFDDEKFRTSDLGFLRHEYMMYNPSLLFIVSWLFKSGVELYAARQHLQPLMQRLAKAKIHSGVYSEDDDSGDDKMDEGIPNVAEAAELEQKVAFYTSIINRAIDNLTQFALIWDLNTRPGTLPPRPGQRPNPADNGDLAEKLHLRVLGWVDDDITLPPWPQRIPLLDEYRGGIIPIDDDPSVIDWLIVVRDYKMSKQPPYVTFNAGVDLPPPPLQFREASPSYSGTTQDSNQSALSSFSASAYFTHTHSKSSECAPNSSLSLGIKRPREEEEELDADKRPKKKKKAPNYIP